MNSSTDPAHLPASDVRVLVTEVSGAAAARLEAQSLLDRGLVRRHHDE